MPLFKKTSQICSSNKGLCALFLFVKIALEQTVQDWHASSGLLSLPYLVCLFIFNPSWKRMSLLFA